MQTITTKKGTELPLTNLKGKPYLMVAYRLVWFREECPNHTIETEFVQLTDTSAIAKASIKYDNMTLATAHKREDKAHFADYMEKAETGAIGRALALIGYGTQFAPEMDEEDRIVDSPVIPVGPVRGQTNVAPGPQIQDKKLEIKKQLLGEKKWAPSQIKEFMMHLYNADNFDQLSLQQAQDLYQLVATNTYDSAKIAVGVK